MGMNPTGLSTPRNYRFLKLMYQLYKHQPELSATLSKLWDHPDLKGDWESAIELRKGVSNMTTRDFLKRSGKQSIARFAITDKALLVIENGDNGLTRNGDYSHNTGGKKRAKKVKKPEVQERLNLSDAAQTLLQQVSEIANSNSEYRDALEQVGLIIRGVIDVENPTRKPEKPKASKNDPLNDSISALNFENSSLKYQLYQLYLASQK